MTSADSGAVPPVPLRAARVASDVRREGGPRMAQADSLDHPAVPSASPAGSSQTSSAPRARRSRLAGAAFIAVAGASRSGDEWSVLRAESRPGPATRVRSATRASTPSSPTPRSRPTGSTTRATRPCSGAGWKDGVGPPLVPRRPGRRRPRRDVATRWAATSSRPSTTRSSNAAAATLWGRIPDEAARRRPPARRGRHRLPAPGPRQGHRRQRHDRRPAVPRHATTRSSRATNRSPSTSRCSTAAA